VQTLPPAVHWGVYSINCFFSVLLILGALLSLRTRIDSGEAARLVPLPFPMPRSMQVVRWSLLAFPILVATCYAVATVAAWRHRRA